MKICIDGLSLSDLMGTGCYSYLYGLSDSLFRVYPQPEYSILLNYNSNLPNHNSNISQWRKYKNVELLNLELDRRDNAYTILEKEIAKNNINLFISPNNGFSLPANKICKYMMIVHDLAPLSIKNMVDDKYSNKFNIMFPRALKNADAIIADSEFIKSEILYYYGVDEKKISVISPCCLDIFKPMNKAAIKPFLHNKYNINGKYLLFVGSIHPRKNLDVLITSFKRFVIENADYKLVIVGDYSGKRMNYYQYLMDLIRTYKLEEKVVFTGKVDHFDMPFLYNGASCVVNISFYEGFPITAIEASACNVPYICLRNSSFKEIDVPTVKFLEKLEVNAMNDILGDVIHHESNSKIRIASIESDFSKFCWDNEVKKFIRVVENVIYG